MTSRFSLYFIVCGLIILSLIGCGETLPEASPVSPTVQATFSPATESLPVPSSTATTTPLPLGILLAPPNADSALVDDLRLLASAQAEETGIRFQIRETLSEKDFQLDDVLWVVALPPFQNLTDLTLIAPETKFLAVGFSDLEAASNLSVIMPESANLDQQGFMAGYIAAIITPDWRVGVISLAENAAGTAAREGFIAGATYFCGLCSPKYPPFFKYPLFVELASDANSSQWQSAANILLNKGVETIYLVPGAGDEALIQYLAQADVKLIGGMDDIPEIIRAQWVVSLRFDLMQSVQEYWPAFMEGVNGTSIKAPLIFEDPNENLFSPGRQRMAEKMLEEILAGYIETQ